MKRSMAVLRQKIQLQNSTQHTINIRSLKTAVSMHPGCNKDFMQNSDFHAEIHKIIHKCELCTYNNYDKHQRDTVVKTAGSTFSGPIKWKDTSTEKIKNEFL